ncbi:MAG: hypothetical protein ABGW77_00995 [Campylobacterales bacterium]
MIVTIVNPRLFSEKRLEEALKRQSLEFIGVFSSRRIYDRLSEKYPTILIGIDGKLEAQNFFPTKRLPPCSKESILRNLQRGIFENGKRIERLLYQEYGTPYKGLGDMGRGLWERPVNVALQIAWETYKSYANIIISHLVPRPGHPFEEFLMAQWFVIYRIFWNFLRGLVYSQKSKYAQYLEFPYLIWDQALRLSYTTLLFYTPTREDLYKLPYHFHHYYLRMLVRRFIEWRHNRDRDMLDHLEYAYRGLETLCLRGWALRKRVERYLKEMEQELIIRSRDLEEGERAEKGKKGRKKRGRKGKK